MKTPDRKLVLEDGSQYYGFGFGARTDSVCEIVFDTSMVGYQEIVSDPSYTDQMVLMSYPLIGNYGITDDDYECKNPTIGGLVVYDYNDTPSNFRYTKTLSELMEENGIPGIYGLDTRQITRSIRDLGSRRALITDPETPLATALATIRATPVAHDAVKRVSCKKRWYSRTSNPQFNVVALDCGIKLSIVKSLNRLGCNVTVVPYDTPAQEIEFMKPDGVLLSNGPGAPEDIPFVVETVKRLKGKYPIFGIGLGHQVAALAYGAKAYKLKFGHHGSNHPVMDTATGCIETVSQCHCWAVEEGSLEGTGLEVTYKDVLDGTVEGLQCSADRLFTAQFYPVSSAGPQDRPSMFKKFVDNMREAKENA